jgi:hypothetical protein
MAGITFDCHVAVGQNLVESLYVVPLKVRDVLSYDYIYIIGKIFEYVFANCDNFSIFFAHNLTFDGLIILNNIDSSIEIVVVVLVVGGGGGEKSYI